MLVVTGFRRELGLLDSVVVVAGGIIGVGIFANPSNVARVVSDPILILFVWSLGGVVALIGAFTAIFAATIGITQNDIKKVLAYSTVSQLGFMFLACGVGAFVIGIFHVMTHAFFKALMFLGSGSVIHGMHHEQDMRRMGGLKKYMPITFATMAIGWLAISGVPPLAGFF